MCIEVKAKSITKMLGNVPDEERLKDEVYMTKKIERKLNSTFHVYEGIFYGRQ